MCLELNRCTLSCSKRLTSLTLVCSMTLKPARFINFRHISNFHDFKSSERSFHSCCGSLPLRGSTFLQCQTQSSFSEQLLYQNLQELCTSSFNSAFNSDALAEPSGKLCNCELISCNLCSVALVPHNLEIIDLIMMARLLSRYNIADSIMFFNTAFSSISLLFSTVGDERISLAFVNFSIKPTF